MDRTIPRRFTHHESITAEEREYLVGLTVGRLTLSYFTDLLEATLATRVDGYHAEYAPDWQNSARRLYKCCQTPELTSEEERAGEVAVEVAIAAYKPGRVLSILRRIEALTMQRRRERAAKMVRRASELPALSTSDRAGHEQYLNDAARMAAETGLTDSQRYQLR